MDNHIIFISWSGPQSREIAHLLKDFLCKVYNRLKMENIFISDTNIAGGNPWMEAIRNTASLIRIAIPCLTSDNTAAPWIHFEVGLCSAILQDDDRATWEKAIIPFLFNFDSKDLDSHLTMLSYHQLVPTNMTIENEKQRFQDLLYSLICRVDLCMAEQGLSDYCHRFGDNVQHLKQMCSVYANTYAKELIKINQKYNKHDFYLSRPMLGVSPTTNHQISSVIKHIYQEYKDKKIYYSQGNSGYDQDNLLESRIAIIKKCKSFILIYPQINDCDSLPPSSCFIELGVALAANLKIFFCIQKGAKIPAFIQEKQYNMTINKDYQIHQFENFSDLQNLLTRIINLRTLNG